MFSVNVTRERSVWIEFELKTQHFDLFFYLIKKNSFSEFRNFGTFKFFFIKVNILRKKI